MGLEAKATQNTLQPTSQVIPENSLSGISEGNSSPNVLLPSDEEPKESGQPAQELQELKTPARMSRNGEILLGNVEKFLGKFQTYRVSAFIENATHQLLVSDYRWLRNMFLSNEFFKGIKCSDVSSRQRVVDEVFEKIIVLVREARGAEARWYRELLSNAALKREAKAKSQRKVEPSESERKAPSVESSNEQLAIPSDALGEPQTPVSPPSPPVSTARPQPTKVQFNPSILRDSVLTIPLTVRTQNLLFTQSTIGTIGDLLMSSAEVFSRVSGVGEKTLLELRDGLVRLHSPLGLLFDPITVLPISDKGIGAIVRLIGEPAPRCFKLLFQDFTKLSEAGVPHRDLLAIYEVFSRNGFNFTARPNK